MHAANVFTPSDLRLAMKCCSEPMSTCFRVSSPINESRLEEGVRPEAAVDRAVREIVSEAASTATALAGGAEFRQGAPDLLNLQRGVQAGRPETPRKQSARAVLVPDTSAAHAA